MVIIIPQEFLIVKETLSRKKHSKSNPLYKTFQDTVNEYLKQGWRVINCDLSVGQGILSTYNAYLVRDV